MRKSLLLSLAVVPLAFFVAPRADGTPVNGGIAVDISTIPGFIMREPVLNFDVTGGTLAGPFHTRVTVYNDGLVTGSTCGGFQGGNSAGTTFASRKAVKQLQKDLVDAGGLKLGDQGIIVADVPPSTVTVFNGTTDAKAHTFSYYLATGEYSKIGQVINDFISSHPVTCTGIVIESVR